MKPEERKQRFSAWLNGDNRLEREMLENQERIADTDIVAMDEAARQHAEAEEEEETLLRERLRAWNERKIFGLARPVYNAVCVLITVSLICIMLYTIMTLPIFGGADNPINNEVSQRYIENGLQETGAVNIVTGMILDYRAFDTLGESTVLFTAAMVVLFLLRIDRESHAYSVFASSHIDNPQTDNFYEPRQDAILQASAWLLLPIILLFGVYIVLNGHLSPGGGFSGGAVMAAGFIIYVMAFGFRSIRRFLTYKLYQRVVLAALLTYALSKCYSFYCGANGLESGIPLGTPGAILSSGLILLLNICVGMVVACTMYAFYAVFRKGEL